MPKDDAHAVLPIHPDKTAAELQEPKKPLAEAKAEIDKVKNEQAGTKTEHDSVQNSDLKAETVARISCGRLDSRGMKIKKVYAKQGNEYAIYKANGDVMIQFADTVSDAQKQRKLILNLGTAKADLNALLAGMNEKKRDIYDSRMATALQQCLEGDADNSAKEIISKAYADALLQRSADGRIQYLIWTAISAIIGIAILTYAQHYVLPFNRAADNLWLVGRAGLIGALLSIGIGIRARTVAIDLYRWSNAAEGALRLFIGVICAGFLLMALTGSVIPEVKVGNMTLMGKEMLWQAVLAIGFVAGFFERLVPDLLEKTGPQPPKTIQQTNTTNSTGAAGYMAAGNTTAGNTTDGAMNKPENAKK